MGTATGEPGELRFAITCSCAEHEHEIFLERLEIGPGANLFVGRNGSWRPLPRPAEGIIDLRQLCLQVGEPYVKIEGNDFKTEWSPDLSSF